MADFSFKFFMKKMNSWIEKDTENKVFGNLFNVLMTLSSTASSNIELLCLCISHSVKSNMVHGFIGATLEKKCSDAWFMIKYAFYIYYLYGCNLQCGHISGGGRTCGLMIKFTLISCIEVTWTNASVHDSKSLYAEA